ncbi:unnamed protein product [Schistosoma curassoni]|uniref:Uncharacterized protein n=1 Tax=Schistosoma curassoni TaxID=6186 RepID=A0A183L6S1_9TREM|nr:unnamed protein product [Schistosoma curassoni]
MMTLPYRIQMMMVLLKSQKHHKKNVIEYHLHQM